MLDVPKTTNMVNEDDVVKGVSNPVVYRLVLTGGKRTDLFVFLIWVINGAENNKHPMNEWYLL